MSGRYSARGVDKEPGWVERRFRETDQRLAELSTGKLSAVPGSIVTIQQVLTDPASPVGFENTDQASAVADDAAVTLALSHIPLALSLHVRQNGVDLLPSEWSLSGQIVTIAPTADLKIRTGDVFSAAYAFDVFGEVANPPSVGYVALAKSLEPLVYPRLTDATAAVMTDFSDNGRDGDYLTGVAVGSAGLVPSVLPDTSADFNGSGQARIDYAAWMDVSTIGLKAWVELDTIADGAIIARDTFPGGRCWKLKVTAAGKLEFGFWTTTGGPYSCLGATVLTTGTKYLLSASYDGTTAKVFVDGVEDGTLTQAGTLQGINGVNLFIGYAEAGSGGSETELIDGRLQEVAMFTALADSDHADLYATGIGS